MEIILDEPLKNVVRVGVALFTGIVNPPDGGDAIWALFSDLSDTLCRQHKGKTAAQVDGVQDARKFYRAVGLDPTKTRPSSEALLRRSLKGKGVYRVHPVVDLLNYVSLKQLMPVGLYDISKIEGEQVRIVIGGADWGFDGIRKARVNVSGRLCVTDALGPFGSPTSDSLRTSINGHVTDALVLFYQSIEGDARFLTDSLALTVSLVSKHICGQAILQQIL
ncbi:MAG: hypothetical protein JXR76_13935 [Deltaproteobacteria bacterium]|nr:hypothetical protein [Deltaproteobacteria bacterium]